MEFTLSRGYSIITIDLCLLLSASSLGFLAIEPSRFDVACDEQMNGFDCFVASVAALQLGERGPRTLDPSRR